LSVKWSRAVTSNYQLCV